MNLKKKKKFNLKSYFTYKNLFIFLLCLLVVALILGGIFFFSLNQNDKKIVLDSISDYYTIYDNYNYINIFKNLSLSTITSYAFIWILGISVIGIVLVLFIYFLEFFSIGFTICAIFSKYKIKGLFAIISYLFPAKLLYLIGFLIGVLLSIKFSYNIIGYLFFKKEIDLREAIKKYAKSLIIILITAIIYSIFDTFITPIMIKLIINFI